MPLTLVPKMLMPDIQLTLPEEWELWLSIISLTKQVVRSGSSIILASIILPMAFIQKIITMVLFCIKRSTYLREIQLLLVLI